MDTKWILLCALLALLGRVGLIAYVTGLSRSKNAASSCVRSLVDMMVVLLGLFLLGLAIAGQVQTPVLGLRFALLACRSSANDLLTFLPATMIIVLLTGSVSAAGIERSRFRPLFVLSLVIGLIVLPVEFNWLVLGWMSKLDLYGTERVVGLLAISVAVSAIVVARSIGGRNGKYHRDGATSMIPAHNIPLTFVGAILMLIGWIAMVLMRRPDAVGFVGALGCIAAAGTASLAYSQWQFSKPDPMLTLSGLLGGAIAIASAGGEIPAWGAIAIGTVAGIVVPWLTVHLDMNLKIDDPSGLSAVNLGGGVIGLLAGVMADANGLPERLTEVGYVLGQIACATIFSGVIVLLTMKLCGNLRSKEADEYDGLDLAEHEINAYPDFQQTTIKSYHMREA